MLILLGPAVEDSANGKDVYKAFAVRMGLFVLVALYASVAIHLLEVWRRRRLAPCRARPEPGTLAMLMNLLFGLTTMGLCLFLQLVLVLAGLRWYFHQQHSRTHQSFISDLVLVNGVMVTLVIGNLAQVGAWALLFQALGEFDRFSAAYYHSAVNFATLGYGDVVMSAGHKLLGPIQAINGVLMIGVSTAALMSAFQHTVKRAFEARRD